MNRITIQYGTPTNAEAFDAYYTETHVPLASRLPGLRRFIQSHPRGLGGEAPYFVAELWFDDAEALKAAMQSPEMAAAAADAQTFDVASLSTFTGEIYDVTS
jgi:uncharacterized protein (TIGR02118 family)